MTLVSLTCHVADVTGPASVRDVKLAIEGDSNVVMGARAMPIVRATAHGDPIVRPRIRLLSSDTMVLAVSASGDSVIGRKLGSVTLTALLESSLFPDAPPAATRTVRVVPRRLTIIPPAMQFDALSDTLPVSVVAYDAADAVIPGARAIFSVANPSLATVTDARVASVAVGTTELRASMAGVDTARASITIGQRLQRFSFQSSLMTLDAIGADTNLVVVGVDARGSVIAGAVPTFQSTDSARVRVTQNGALRALANGAAYVLAVRPDGNADSLRVVVNQRATRLIITPVTTTSIRSQFGQIKLAAFAYDRLGQTVTDDVPFWTSSNDRIATVDSGRVATVTGRARGVAWIVAHQDNARDSVLVAVINDPASIVLTPDAATLVSANDSLPIRTVIRNGDGGVIDSIAYTVTSSDTAVARVLNNDWLVAVDTGRVRLIARVQSVNGPIADTTIVDVLNLPETVDISVAEDTMTYIGDTLTVPINILNRRGAALPRSRASWDARPAGVATVSSTGRVVANAVGSTFVIAQAGAIRDSMRIVVTNLVASVAIDGIVNGAVDTLPTLGANIPYAATVWGTSGSQLPNYPTTWLSTSPGIVTVSATGVVTTTGFGSASVIVRAGAAADTVQLLVRRPSRWHVDNRRAGAVTLGTLARPFATIGAAVGSSSSADTVLVAPGARYVESLSIGSRLTILGDSASFVVNGRDPTRLATISHEAGSAAITATGGPVTVRYLSIVHAVPGAAISVADADATISSVFVNPGRVDAPLGSGILIQRAPLNARVDSVRVESVRGYGVRFVNVAGARVMRTHVTGVMTDAGGAPSSSEDGAGIAILGGRGALVSSNVVLTTDGPELLLSATTDASATANIVSGERQLVRLSGVAGFTTVSDNSFDISRIAAEPFTGNSSTDGRSGLEVAASTGVQIERNRFHDAAGVASQMDAVHLVDTRTTRLDANHFVGGRRAVRSERSTWDMLRSRADSVVVAVETLSGDTITFSDDTLAAASVSCLAMRDVVAQVNRLTLMQCGVGNSPALGIVGGSLIVDGLDVRGTNPRAVRADSAGAVRLRRAVVRGPFAGTVGVGGLAGVELDADSITVTASFVTGYPDRAGIYLDGRTVRVDSTTVNRARSGLIVGGSPTTIDIRDNDLADADSAALRMRAGAQVSVPGTWWGDGRGPAGASAGSVGDTIVGPVLASGYRTLPFRAGSVAALLASLRGDGQSAPSGSNLPRPLSVRLVDADGLPVKGVAVKFTIPSSSNSTFSNGLKTVNVITNDSGIAEATVKVRSPGTPTVVTVTAPGAPNTLTFTATAT